jgi:hypothetical protein
MKRYTSKSLEHDLKSINTRLEAIGHDKRLQVGGAYGRTYLELRTADDNKGCILRNLEQGTPRECLAAAHAYVSGLVSTQYTRTGTHHFKDMQSAWNYYKQQAPGIRLADVIRKHERGEIACNAPAIKPGEKLSVDTDGRYWIERGE